MSEAEAIKHATAPVEATWLKERQQALRSHPISFERLRRTRPEVVNKRIQALQQHLLEYNELFIPLKTELKKYGQELPPDFDTRLEILAFVLAKAMIENAISLNLTDEQLVLVVAQQDVLESRGSSGEASSGWGGSYGVIRIPPAELFYAYQEIDNLEFLINLEKGFMRLENPTYPAVVDVMRAVIYPSNNNAINRAVSSLNWHDAGGLTDLSMIIAHELFHIRQLIADPQFYYETGLASEYLLPEKKFGDFNGDVGEFELYDQERTDKLPLYSENIGELSARKQEFRYLYYLRRRIEQNIKAGTATALDKGMKDVVDNRKAELAKEIRAIKEARVARGQNFRSPSSMI